MKKLKLALICLLAIFAMGILVHQTPKVYALSDANIQADYNTGSGCSPTVNYTSSTYADVESGQAANLSFLNYSSYPMSVVVQQVGESNFSETVPADNGSNPGLGGGYTTAPISGDVTITATPSCTSASSTYYLEAAQATLQCKLNGSTWNITGSYSNVVSGAVVYNTTGSYTVANLGSNANSTSSINLNVNANSSGANMAFYDGANYGKGTQLVSTECPLYKASGGSSAAGNNGSNHGNTGSTGSATTTTTSANGAASPTSVSTNSPNPYKNYTPVKSPVLKKLPRTTSTSAKLTLVIVPFLGIIIVAVLLLNFYGLIPFSNKILRKLTLGSLNNRLAKRKNFK